MSLKTVVRGNRVVKQPGTCIQPGNNAPRFRWQPSIRVLIACIAYHLECTDDGMGRLRKFPQVKNTFKLFQKTVPWFENLYNSSQQAKAAEKNYPIHKLQPFGPDDVHGRLHYLFSKPGKNGHSPHDRLYGISREHHDSIEQHKKGGRAYIFAKCSKQILKRLRFGEIITQKEINKWSIL